MQLNLKFRDQITSLGAWLTTEFDQFMASVRAAWLVEHTEDDQHKDVHAYSLTLTKNTTTGQTGNLTVGGTATVAGNLRANGVLIGQQQDPGSSVANTLIPVLAYSEWGVYERPSGDELIWVHPSFVDGLFPSQYTAMRLRISGGNGTLKGGPLGGSCTADFSAFRTGEKGTWTPALFVGGADPGDFTYSSRVGTWTRFDDRIILNANIVLSAKSATAGNYTISGLPTAGAGTEVNVGHFQPVANCTGMTEPHVTVSGSTLFLLNNVASNAVQMTDANFNNTSNFRITVVYKV